jgi:hypothetical protein
LKHLENAKKLALGVKIIKTTEKNFLVQIIPCLVSKVDPILGLG